MCQLLGLEPAKHIDLVDLPQRMTLEKWPGLERQKRLLNFEPIISVEEGIKRVLKTVQKAVELEEGVWQ